MFHPSEALGLEKQRNHLPNAQFWLPVASVSLWHGDLSLYGEAFVWNQLTLYDPVSPQPEMGIPKPIVKIGMAFLIII